MYSTNPILNGLAISTLWLLGGLIVGPSRPGVESNESENPLAFRRSAYGGMAARLMKDSMHNYWHAGQAEHHPGDSHSSAAGSVAEHSHAHPSGKCPESEGKLLAGTNDAWLERRIDWLADLEEARQAPTASVPISKAHRKYLDATANWHLRVAYQLDPGDAALYEILHYAVIAAAPTPEAAKRDAEKIAAQTIAHALSEEGGMSAALTGAGAAINLLNNEMVSGSAASPEILFQHWHKLSQCLNRYHALRKQAGEEGWWEGIPSVRRGELSSYAALVEKLSGTIGRKLSASGVLRS